METSYYRITLISQNNTGYKSKGKAVAQLLAKMIPTRSSLVVFLVTVFLNPRYVLCTHFNASSTVHRQLGDNSAGAGSPNSFSSDSINVNLDGSSAAPSTFSIAPSVSYQFHTNDHEHLDKIVLAHHNPVRNSFSSGVSPEDNEASGSSTVERVEDDMSSRVANFPSAGVNANNNPALDLSSHRQQQQGSTVQQIRGDWQGKQGQQPLWQYHQPRNPQAILDKRNVQPQRKVQVGNVQQGSANAQSKLVSNLTQRRQQQQKSPNPNLQYQARKDTPSPSSIIYSRPLQNDSPTTYQWENKHAQPKVRNIVPTWRPPTSQTTRFNATEVKRPGTKSAFPSSRKKKPSSKRKILTSRADTYENEDEDEEETEDEADNESVPHYHPYDYRYGQYENVKEETGDQENEAEQNDDDDDGYYYSQDGTPPEIRDFGLPPDGGLPGGPPEPLPPPPIKGTVDYILIPLILIGLAGPIFVVLYVILGGFEYKLAPIARSLKSQTAEYQPYIDSLSSSVGRALEKYECYEYASCRFHGLYNKVGLSSATTSTIEETLNAVTPKEYLPTLTKVFSSLNHPRRNDNCQKYQCSDMVDYFL